MLKISRFPRFTGAHRSASLPGSALPAAAPLTKRLLKRTYRKFFTQLDYARLGMVRVLWEPDGIRISGPGGFPDGVTQSNLLTIDPTPRNPRLADVLKRIGLVESSRKGNAVTYRLADASVEQFLAAARTVLASTLGKARTALEELEGTGS